MRPSAAICCLWLALAGLAPWCAARGAPLSPTESQGRELFRKLIGFNTAVGNGQVPAMAALLAGEFRAAGFPESDIHLLPLGETASLIIRYRGDGQGGRPILLEGHMDVVTAKPEDWQRDPFTLIEEHGYFFGRGSLDMKCGVAALTMAFLTLKAEGFVPRRDLIIVFTGDEETTQDTALDVAHHHRDLIDSEFGLNADTDPGTLDERTGEPILYSLQTAEKTYMSFSFTVHNPGGHSSQPRADNAIYELADTLRRLQQYHFPVMSNDTTRRYFAALGLRTAGQLGAAMREFAVRPREGAAAATIAAAPTYVGATRTTCIPTLLSGGHADNALPQSASVVVNCRIFPGVRVAEVQATLQRIAGAAVTVKPLTEPIESVASPIRADVFAAVTRTVHRRHPGAEVVPEMSSAASDGAVFSAVGIPTYGTKEVFIKYSEDFEHGLNERLPVQSFYDGLDFWHALLIDLAGPGPQAATP